MIQEKERLDKLDKVCVQLNQAAHTYVSFVSKELDGQEITTENLNEILLQQITRYSYHVVNTMLLNTFALVGRCANVTMEEGDLVTLTSEDVEVGRQLVEQNPLLIGQYILPLLLYSVEYARLSYELIRPEDVTFSDGSSRPDEEYNEIILMLIGGAVQTRYFYIRQWFNRTTLGECVKEDLSEQIVQSGRLIDERE